MCEPRLAPGAQNEHARSGRGRDGGVPPGAPLRPDVAQRRGMRARGSDENQHHAEHEGPQRGSVGLEAGALVTTHRGATGATVLREGEFALGAAAPDGHGAATGDTGSGPGGAEVGLGGGHVRGVGGHIDRHRDGAEFLGQHAGAASRCRGRAIAADARARRAVIAATARAEGEPSRLTARAEAERSTAARGRAPRPRSASAARERRAAARSDGSTEGRSDGSEDGRAATDVGTGSAASMDSTARRRREGARSQVSSTPKSSTDRGRRSRAAATVTPVWRIFRPLSDAYGVS